MNPWYNLCPAKKAEGQVSYQSPLCQKVGQAGSSPDPTELTKPYETLAEAPSPLTALLVTHARANRKAGRFLRKIGQLPPADQTTPMGSAPGAEA